MNLETNKPWSLSTSDLIKALASSGITGLSNSESARRLLECGPNTIGKQKPISHLKILVNQLTSIIVGLLLVAATISFALQHWTEGIAIISVLVINTALGYFTELKAIRSMEALRRLGLTYTKVIRHGDLIDINAEELVPGDLVVFEAGDVVTADARLVKAANLMVNESALTGESAPVEKTADKLVEATHAGTPLPERTNMLHKGTAIAHGSAKAIVTGTGFQTEIGRVAELVAAAQESLTPLEERLDRLGQRLVWVTIFIAFGLTLVGYLSGKDVMLMIETSIALAVATIPEGLPIVATMALAKGMWKMAQKNALVNRLSAVETLGATTVIITDKTGTLTENKMVARVYFLNGQRLPISDQMDLKNKSIHSAYTIGSLCNNASLSAGDPMEIALIKAAEDAGLDSDELKTSLPRLKEFAFDPETRMMATYHNKQNSVYIAVKGAPEEVVEVCSYHLVDGQVTPMGAEQRNKLILANNQLAADGLRVLGLAFKETDSIDSPAYEKLIFVALVGLQDPPRADVREAIQSCQQAGIRVIMATGDQEETARKIGQEVALFDQQKSHSMLGKNLGKPETWLGEKLERLKNTSIFSRVSPEQKLDLVQFYQNQGAVVAVTGDGINDAPALKKADIGIAMGLRGTQVAKDVSDMVLKDDQFGSIVIAINQGRVIFNNIRRFVVYLLSCNISEVLIISMTAVVDAPLPILPLQILFLNLVTDVFPALALGMGEGDESYLKNPPRAPTEPILTTSLWWTIWAYAGLMTVTVLGVFAVALLHLHKSTHEAVTMAFLTLGLVQLFHVFNMRSPKAGLFVNDVTKNVYVWGAVLLCLGLLGGAVYLPYVKDVLRLTAPNPNDWGLIVGASLLPVLVIQSIFLLSARRK